MGNAGFIYIYIINPLDAVPHAEHQDQGGKPGETRILTTPALQTPRFRV